MKTIEQNIIDGNFGESLVAYKFSKFCLVRHVSSGTDIGIDLYLESIDIKKRPFIHFWIQVKTGSEKYITILKGEKIASFKFDKKHLEYWKNQPVPVFIVLVPKRHNEINKFRFYIINMTEHLIKQPHVSKDKTIRSSILIGNDQDLEKFVNETIPITTARNKIKDGIIAPIPEIDNCYEKTFKPEGTSMYSKKILQSIRRTSSIVIGDIIENQKKDRAEYKDELEKFEKILLTFDDDKHWETYYNLGKCAHLKGDYSNAYNYYNKSRILIESDRNLSQTNIWNEKIKKIKKLEKLALDEIEL